MLVGGHFSKEQGALILSTDLTNRKDKDKRMEVVYRWEREIRQHLRSLGAWQSRGLALFSYGVMKGRHSSQSRIAEELGAWGSGETVKKRLKRWLGNKGIEMSEVSGEWVAWVWSAYGGERAILLVDETKLSDRLGVMMVALAYEGRAIPLVWRCYKADQAGAYPPEGQVELVGELVEHVVQHLPPESRPLVLADRGLGHSSAMLQRLSQIPHLHYLVRIKETSRVTFLNGMSSLLYEITTPDCDWASWAKLFTRTRSCYGIVRVLWRSAYAEPWCLVTNDPFTPSSTYAQRWWQEESFRDLKSGGWQWEQSYVTIPDHAEKLILILALAYGWAIALGVTQEPAHPTTPRRFSLFRQGIRYFKRLLDSAQAHLIPTTLAFPVLRC